MRGGTWGTWGEWGHWTAIVPMRTQPLHVAHVNVLANLVEHFGAVRVVIGDQPRSDDDPYRFDQRVGWWLRSADVHHLPRAEFVRGAHGSNDADRVHRYVDGLPASHIALVSGNQEVADFWSSRRLPVLDIRTLPLRDVVGHDDARLRQGDGLGRRLRRALRAGDGGDVRPLIPPWVWDDVR